MFKVLIVDDEPIIGKGIRTILNNYPKYHVIGIATNGKEALTILNSENPDIVLTDIEMPLINGIKLTEEIRRMDKEYQIIYISAFRDFKYAQAAINLKVDTYLVKPIDENDLLVALEKAASAIDKKQLLNQFILKEQLQQYFYGKKLPKLNYIGLVDDKQNFCILYIQKSHLENSIPIEFWDRIFRVFKNKISFQEKDYSIYYLLEGFSEIDWDREVFYLRQLFPEWHFYTKSFSNLNKIYFVLGEIQKQRSNDFFKSTINSNKEIISMTVEKLLTILNKSYDYSFFIDSFNNLIDCIASDSDYQLSKFHKKMDEILFIIFNALSDNLNKFELTSEKSMQLITKWKIELSLVAYKTVINEQFDSWFKGYGDFSMSRVPEDIYLIKEYIQNNFKRDITLDELALLVHKNKSYVSSYFKKHTGNNFKSFQTDLRMEEARILLINTDKRVYEIADEIGYIGTHHFNKVFYTYFGVSPTQYRENKK